MCVLLQLNIAYPPNGTQKKLEVDEDSKLYVLVPTKAATFVLFMLRPLAVQVQFVLF